MAYDAQGHRITTYRGETGYWVDDEEEPYFVRAKAVSYAPPGAATTTLAQALPQVSATSGGQVAPSNLVTVPATPDQGDGEAWQPGQPGFTYDADTVAKGSDGRYYAIDTAGNLQMVASANGMTGGFGTGTQLQEGPKAPITKAMIDQQFANQGGGSFLGDMGELLGGGLSALKEAAPGIALVGGAGLLGGAFPSIYGGIGGAGTIAGGEGAAILKGGTGLIPDTLAASGYGAIPGSEAFASLAADPIGSLIASNAANWGATVAPEIAALGMGAGAASLAAATTPAAATVPPAVVPPAAAAPGITLPQAAAGASLAGTAATLGGDSGADYLGGLSADDPMIDAMAKQGIDIGLSDPTFGLPADLADFIRSQGGTFDSVTQAPSGVPLSDFAPSVPTGTASTGSLSKILDGTASAEDYLKLGLPLAGAALGGLGADGKPAGTTTTVQDLPDWLKPYVTGNLDAAKAYMAANPQNNSLLDPARSELNKTIAGDYLNSNPANAFYSGAQNYVNPGIAGMQAGASGAYVGQNPADAGYRAAQGYTNPGIDLLRPAATGAYVGQNPSDPYYKAAANYTNASMDYLRPTAEGAFLNANPYIDAMYAKARDAVGTGIDSRFSKAGRYGSGAHQGVLGTTFDNLATDIYGNNYATERANMLSAGGTLISADQAQQAARLAGASGLSGNYQNDKATQLAAAGNLGTLSQAEQAARLAGTAGLSSNYNQDRTLQYNYGQAQTAAEQAQQAARLAGASGLSSNYNAARNNQLTAATAAPGFTADAATSPFAAFNAFGNLTKGLGVSQTSSPYFTNPTAGALSGALAGYGLSKAFG